jgi:hypothetical protein
MSAKAHERQSPQQWRRLKVRGTTSVVVVVREVVVTINLVKKAMFRLRLGWQALPNKSHPLGPPKAINVRDMKSVERLERI